MASITAKELRARFQLHETMLKTRDTLDGISPLDGVFDERDLLVAEGQFEELATTIVELSAGVAGLRSTPGLSVEGALVVGAVETAIAVVRTTLASMQASIDAARSERAA